MFPVVSVAARLKDSVIRRTSRAVLLVPLSQIRIQAKPRTSSSAKDGLYFRARPFQILQVAFVSLLRLLLVSIPQSSYNLVFEADAATRRASV